MILWKVTVSDALDWQRYILQRRYEWAEIIFGAIGGKDGEPKRCSDPVICGMCQKKRCGARVTVH